MPPLWGLGFWHRVPSKFSAAQTLEEIAQFESHQIPLDVVGLEPGWQTKSTDLWSGSCQQRRRIRLPVRDLQ